MKKEYDFSKGTRGAIDPTPPGKRKITIRLDNDIIEWFRDQVETRGGGNYQTMINNALREHINYSGEAITENIRSVIREEISKMSYHQFLAFPSETSVNKGMRKDIGISAIDLMATSTDKRQ